MEKTLKIQDTCGIHNLHAMPGVIGGIVGAITAASASVSVYGQEGYVYIYCIHIHTQSASVCTVAVNKIKANYRVTCHTMVSVQVN